MSTILDLDSLLDSTLDNVEDVPDFVQPPAGLYRLACQECKIEQNKKKDKKTNQETVQTRIRLTHKVVATVELKNEKDTPVADGSLFSETFMANEDGLKFFKKQAKNIMNVEDMNGVPLRDVISELANVEYDARVSIRLSKGDEGQEYENAQVRIVPPAPVAAVKAA